MTHRIVRDILCDVCMTKGDEVEAETMPAIAVGKAKPRELDLCVQHKRDLFDPLANLLNAKGRTDGAPVYAAPKRTATTVVELDDFTCGDCHRQFATEPGLNRHRTVKHSKRGRRKAG